MLAELDLPLFELIWLFIVCGMNGAKQRGKLRSARVECWFRMNGKEIWWFLCLCSTVLDFRVALYHSYLLAPSFRLSRKMVLADIELISCNGPHSQKKTSKKYSLAVTYEGSQYFGPTVHLRKKHENQKLSQPEDYSYARLITRIMKSAHRMFTALCSIWNGHSEISICTI